VGVNTVLADDPRLDVRLKNRYKALLRVILDPHCKTPYHAQVIVDSLPTLLVVKDKYADQNWLKTVTQIPNKEVYVDSSPDDEIDLNALLLYLGQKKQIVSLLVEGGSYTLGQFVKQGLSDFVFAFIGNRLIGEGLSPMKGYEVALVQDGISLNKPKIKQLHDNFLIYGAVSTKK
jgi:diaminohydroxyphosphoribosylaminopyrimidine deaminase/5-amino-6-(5-phosphoribosylamino)uracil reductase